MSTDRTDPMAAHRAAQQLRDVVGPLYVDKVVDQFTVHFERRVNEHGVAVRRVVMYGPEEVDPNPPAATPKTCGTCDNQGFGCPDCLGADENRMRAQLERVAEELESEGSTAQLDSAYRIREVLAGRYEFETVGASA